jgi:hypothetical protein
MRSFPKFPAGSTAPPREPVPSALKTAPAGAADDVVEVLAAEVRERFGYSLDDLRIVAATQPDKVPGAVEVLRWYDQLTEAQQFLQVAEDALVDVLLAAGGGPLTEDQMDLARTVDAAVTVRDGRALVVAFLLNPDAPGKRAGAVSGEALGVRRPPALTASLPPRPAAPVSAPARGVGR